VKSLGKYALVVLASLLFGSALFVASFVAMDFGCTHLVKSHDIDVGDGIMVVGGGFILGTSLGLTGAGYVLYRYWPRSIPKEGS
jgi:hypothetical protein